MKTEREAIEMALDLIESEFTTKGENKYSPDEVIEALRQVLAQPEFVLNGIDCSCGRKWRIVNNTLTASAQPEQEPVAWLQFRDNEPPVVAPRDLGTPVFLGIRGGLAHDAGEKP